MILLLEVSFTALHDGIPERFSLWDLFPRTVYTQLSTHLFFFLGAYADYIEGNEGQVSVIQSYVMV